MTAVFLRTSRLLEPFSWRTQEGALSRGKGVIGLGYQVWVRDHHGLPGRCLHHVSCVTERKREKRQESGGGKQIRKKLNGQANETSAQINKFLKSLGLYDSICVDCSSEALRIRHTSWQSCYLLYIFKYLTPPVILREKNTAQIKGNVQGS